MSAQQKKSEHTSSDQQKDTHFQNIRNSRPNIDHLLKRINGERKQERNNNLIMLVAGIIAVGFISLIIV